MNYQHDLPWKDHHDLTKIVYQGLVASDIGRVWQGREYSGQTTGDNFTVDVSVELEISSRRILILVDCKPTGYEVSIDDVYELVSKFEESGANYGVIVSPDRFSDELIENLGGGVIALVNFVETWSEIQYAQDPPGLVYSIPRVGAPYDVELKKSKQPSDAREGAFHYLAGMDKVQTVGFTVTAPGYPLAQYTKMADAWKSIVAFLVDRDGKLGFNTDHQAIEKWNRRIEQKARVAQQEERERCLAYRIQAEHIEKERQHREPDAPPHVFGDNGICRNCSCTTEAVAYFGWWGCDKNTNRLEVTTT